MKTLRVTVLGLCALAATVTVLSTRANAAPITFNFKTILVSPPADPYGLGSFTFDDSLLIGLPPHTITQAQLTSFTYSDPVITTAFTLADLASFNFTIGTTPTTSSFAFVAQSFSPTTRIFVGGVVDGNNVGGASIDIGSGSSSPFLRFPTAATVTAVPEPSTMLLVGAGLALAACRRRR